MYHMCVPSISMLIYTNTYTCIYASYTLILINVLYSLNEVSGEREGDEWAYSDAYENELSDYSSSLDQMNSDGASDQDDDSSSDSNESSSSSSSSSSSGSYTPVTSAEGEGEEYFDWTHIAKGRHKRPLHSSSSSTTTTTTTSNTVFPSISASFSTTPPTSTSTSSVKRSSSSSPSSSSSSQSLWESSSSMTNLQTIKASTQTRRPVKNNGK